MSPLTGRVAAWLRVRERPVWAETAKSLNLVEVRKRLTFLASRRSVSKYMQKKFPKGAQSQNFENGSKIWPALTVAEKEICGIELMSIRSELESQLFITPPSEHFRRSQKRTRIALNFQLFRDQHGQGRSRHFSKHSVFLRRPFEQYL